MTAKKKNLLDIKVDNSKIEDSYEDFDFLDLDVAKATIKKDNKKKEPVKYEPVKKDFVKVDRNVIDVVVPFLNSRCSPGTSILYIELYRMTYGYGKNTSTITDEVIEKRVSIPRRTIMKYRNELIEYDLIEYTRGNRKQRGQYLVKLPHQSVLFSDYLHKTAQSTTKNVGNVRLYNSNLYKDKFFIDSEKLVWDFYKQLGYKQTSMTRQRIEQGIKIILELLNDGHDFDTIKDCLEWMPKYCKDNNKELYGIGFISWLIADYTAEKVKQSNQAAVLKREREKAKERDRELQEEALLMTRYNQLPRNKQTELITQAQDMTTEYITKHKLQNSEISQKWIREGYLLELMKGINQF
tara:strand:+ start:631 stop:1689 length:1059 start_codon:yes stop_codon:yes gene_type:complete